jgi:Pyridoxamine 5'-phosphate oxidase
MKIIRDRPKSVDLDEFLSRPLFGFLATASESGPRVSPVWFVWEDDAIWIIGNQKTDTFPSRVKSEPRCAIAFVDFDASSGLVHHVGMRGSATVEAWDKERASRILRRYLGSNEEQWDGERFVEPLDDAGNVLVRLTPETAVVRDQSYRAPRPPRP